MEWESTRSLEWPFTWDTWIEACPRKMFWLLGSQIEVDVRCIGLGESNTV